MPTGQQGTEITSERCVKLKADERFHFNVMGGKSDKTGPFTTEFHLITWNFDACCWSHAKGDFVLDVRNIPCQPDKREPVVPTMNLIAKSDSSLDYEVQLLCCPNCSGAGPDPPDGRLYAPFIAWPTPAGTMIEQGFSQGWKIQGNSLFSPDPKPKEYRLGN